MYVGIQRSIMKGTKNNYAKNKVKAFVKGSDISDTKCSKMDIVIICQHIP